LDDKTRTSVTIAKDTIVAQYRIIEKIGFGGMGEVYLAFDTRLDRRVALKFMPAHLVADDELKSRFVREAKAAAKLHHPHIVTIYEVGEYKNLPFFAMEYVEGKLLHHYAHDEPLPISTIIEYAVQLCQGLGEAHRAGIVHRDIKSRNIAVDKNGRTRILDFGLAAVQDEDQITKTGSTLGTVSYMSPEQVSGREIDHRSDLFSLGIVLYELIAGRTPFKRNSEGATLGAIMQDDPEPLTRFRSNVPDALRQVVSKLLEKDRELRYQTAEGVLADLKKMLYDSQQTVSSSGSGSKKRRRITTALAGAVVLTIAILGTLFFGNVFNKPGKQMPVLVVLPFENLGSPEDEYFSEGITDEISSRLATISGMRVISRSSANKYKNTDKTAEEIGRELSADFVLEGSIRWDKSGEVERIRITPRLTQTSNDYQLWSSNYEHDLTQIFEVQATIADQIVDQLGLTLLEPDQIKKAAAPTSNMAAYDYYLRGLEQASNGVLMNNLNAAINMFDSAVALDPDFALAWAQKSLAHSRFDFGYEPENANYHSQSARKAADKALSLDPNLAMGRIALGTYYNLVQRDYDRALTEFAKAESEVTSNADLSEAIGIVKMRQGKWQEALSKFGEAARLDPLNVNRYSWLATCNSLIRDFASADQYISRALALAPNNVDAAFFRLYLNLLEHGRLDFGSQTFDKVAQKAGYGYVGTYEVGTSNLMGIWRFLGGDVRPYDMIAEVRGLEGERSSYVIAMNLAELFKMAGEPDSARLYLDSTKRILEQRVVEGTDAFDVYGSLGYVYACLGMTDQAIAAGKKSMVLMPVEECHW
jgi:serine/threonine protein kinase